MKKSINIILLLTATLFSIWCTGDLMRKNDQAAILAGAYDLAHGRMQSPSVYYQYDKTYILYWACASVLKFVSGEASPIVATNISLALIFWFSLAIFVIRFRKILSPLVLLCFLTAPAVFLNTGYLNSSILSSAFLLLAATFLLQDGNRGSWLAAMFFFLSVGSRADVILLLPLLLWLITPFPVILKSPAIFSKHAKICGAGLLAMIAGRILCLGGGAPVIDPFFNFKMVAGYTVFGFGAAGLFFIFYATQLSVKAWAGRGVHEKLYGIAGLLAFLLPVLFFIPQLHAPRYFWRGCEAVLLLAASMRLPGLNFRSIKILVALAALLPMFFGLRLPALTRPQMTVLDATLFPSGDGFYPMGSYFWFMCRLRNAGENPVDHNQMIWNAVKKADFRFDDFRSIKVLRTPMSGYFMLEASLRGGVADCRSYSGLSNCCFYADSRSLMRDDPKTPINSINEILALPEHFVSPVASGVGVLEFGVGDDQWGRQTRLLNRLFAGNEYRIFPADQTQLPNRMTITFSSQPFEKAQRDSQTGLYYSKELVPYPSREIYCAVAVFPSWMSLGAFKGSGQ